MCITVLTGNRMWGTAGCGRPPLLLPSCRKLEFRLSSLMDSDLAWVNGKSGRQSWRFPALYNIGSHLPFLPVTCNEHVCRPAGRHDKLPPVNCRLLQLSVWYDVELTIIDSGLPSQIHGCSVCDGLAACMGGASIGAGGGVISPHFFYTMGVKGVHKLITTIQ